MRREELGRLKIPYDQPRDLGDRRFNSAIGADAPSAGQLARSIYDDLDLTKFGIGWWSSVPAPQRILIGDYLFQCADSIESNLAEAQLHFWEWLHARERHDETVRGMFSLGSDSRLILNYPESISPMDDLPTKLEGLHICGFFQAIGSCLDCLAGAVVGVLGLKKSLRKAGIKDVDDAVAEFKARPAQMPQVILDCLRLFEDAKLRVGPVDWLTWSTSYRNMFIHRGRRFFKFGVLRSEVLLFDAQGQVIPRVDAQLNLAQQPNQSDVEAFLRPDPYLTEDARATMSGVFASTRDFVEIVCEALVDVWNYRRANPMIVIQPTSQWTSPPKQENFPGYTSVVEPSGDKTIGMPTVMRKRLFAAAVVDQHRKLWAGSPWI